MHRRWLEVQLYRLQHPRATSLSVPELQVGMVGKANTAESELEADTEVASTEGYNADSESMNESVHAHVPTRDEPRFQGGEAPCPRDLQSLRAGGEAAAAAAARAPNGTTYSQAAAGVRVPRAKFHLWG